MAINGNYGLCDIQNISILQDPFKHYYTIYIVYRNKNLFRLMHIHENICNANKFCQPFWRPPKKVGSMNMYSVELGWDVAKVPEMPL